MISQWSVTLKESSFRANDRVPLTVFSSTVVEMVSKLNGKPTISNRTNIQYNGAQQRTRSRRTKNTSKQTIPNLGCSRSARMKGRRVPRCVLRRGTDSPCDRDKATYRWLCGGCSPLLGTYRGHAVAFMPYCTSFNLSLFKSKYMTWYNVSHIQICCWHNSIYTLASWLTWKLLRRFRLGFRRC